MNFAALKGLTIPEGKVTKITDASGRVLWSAGPKTVKLNIAGTGTVFCYVQIGDGQPYYGETTVSVPVGTVIKCVATHDTANPATAGKTATATLNGTTVAEGRPAYYEHIITTNTNIALIYIASTTTNYYHSSISIIETYGVNLNAVSNGTLTTTSNGAVGSTVTLTPTPDEGYVYSGATVTYTLNGVEQTIELDANTTAFTMPAADVTITPLWSAVVAPTTATLTIDADSSSNSDVKGEDVYISINADIYPFPNIPQYVVNPFKVTCENGGTHTFEVPIGTIINCKPKGKVYVNGTQVADGSYDYVVTGDAAIKLRADSSLGTTYGKIEITEQ